LPLAQIHYRYHPFYEKEVQVVRWLRRISSEIVVVKLPEGLQIALPSWMLDLVVCDQLSDEPQPRISVSALRRLRDLIDSQSLLATISAVHCCASESPGGNDAQQQPITSLSTTVSSVPKRELVGEAPRTDSAALSGASCAASANRGSSRTRGKEPR
jgi:hypothetical protein